MKSSIKKFEGQVIKNADKIKGGENGKGTRNSTTNAGTTRPAELL